MIGSTATNIAQMNEQEGQAYLPRMSSHSLEKHLFKGRISHHITSQRKLTCSAVEEELPPVQVVTVTAGHFPPNPRAGGVLRRELFASLGPS